MNKINLGCLHPKYEGMYVPAPQISPDGECRIPRDNEYELEEKMADAILFWLSQESAPLWVYGPHGAGKTQLVLSTAARLNKPIVVDNGSPDREAADFIGMPAIKGGDTTTQLGGLALAAQEGWWYLLNEADLIRPGVMAALNTVLDGTGVLTIPFSGEVVKIKPGFRFIVTANTAGRGDLTGQYQTEVQNAALMDRFIKIRVSYPSPETERSILRKAAPNLDATLIKAFIDFANAVRSVYEGKEVELEGVPTQLSISITLSTRTLVRWAQGVEKFAGAISPWQVLNYLLGLDDPALEVDKEAVGQIYRTFIGEI